MVTNSNSNKTIITAALVGATTLKEQNPAVPYTPEEYAKEALKCYEAGASIVHIHARTDEGLITQNPKRYEEIIQAIKEKCPEILINITGGTGATEKERLSPIKLLLPEICSIDTQTMNWVNINPKTKKVMYEGEYVNTFHMMIRMGRVTKRLGIRPEIEVFSENGLYNILYIQKTYKVFVEPMHIQYVFGVVGGAPFSIQNLAHYRAISPPESTWCVCGIAKDQFKANACAVIEGGHIRVGLEDNIRMPDRSLAKGSFEQVEWASKLIKMVGRQVATPDDTKQILNLRK